MSPPRSDSACSGGCTYFTILSCSTPRKVTRMVWCSVACDMVSRQINLQVDNYLFRKRESRIILSIPMSGKVSEWHTRAGRIHERCDTRIQERSDRWIQERSDTRLLSCKGGRIQERSHTRDRHRATPSTHTRETRGEDNLSKIVG